MTFGERRGELAHVFLEPLAWIREHERRAFGRRGLRDRPGDRPLVGDTDDETDVSGELSH